MLTWFVTTRRQYSTVSATSLSIICLLKTICFYLSLLLCCTLFHFFLLLQPLSKKKISEYTFSANCSEYCVSLYSTSGKLIDSIAFTHIMQFGQIQWYICRMRGISSQDPSHCWMMISDCLAHTHTHGEDRKCIFVVLKQLCVFVDLAVYRCCLGDPGWVRKMHSVCRSPQRNVATVWIWEHFSPCHLVLLDINSPLFISS